MISSRTNSKFVACARVRLPANRKTISRKAYTTRPRITGSISYSRVDKLAEPHFGTVHEPDSSGNASQFIRFDVKQNLRCGRQVARFECVHEAFALELNRVGLGVDAVDFVGFDVAAIDPQTNLVFSGRGRAQVDEQLDGFGVAFVATVFQPQRTAALAGSLLCEQTRAKESQDSGNQYQEHHEPAAALDNPPVLFKFEVLPNLEFPYSGHSRDPVRF